MFLENLNISRFRVQPISVERSPGGYAVRVFSPFLAAWLLLTSSALATPNQATVKVVLFSAKGIPGAVILDGPFVVMGRRSFTAPPGRFRLASEGGCVQLVALAEGGRGPVLLRERSLEIKPVAASSVKIESTGTTSVRSRTRSYRGVLSVSTQSLNGIKNASRKNTPLTIINEVSRREYLAGVVASEMPAAAPLEALKALAVLANTQVAKLLPRELLKDSTELEAYAGVPESRTAAYAAVDAVGGEILRFDGKIIDAYFHSTCAGMTSRAVDIFGGSSNPDYLTNVECNHCAASPFFKVLTTSIPRARFDTVFGAHLPEIKSTDVAGRPTAVSYSLKGHQLHTTGYEFWLHFGQEFGWDKAPGTNFSLREENGQVVIKSRGAGHGVGLCQWGAIGLAKQGRSYRAILSAYFPGTTISK